MVRVKVGEKDAAERFRRNAAELGDFLRARSDIHDIDLPAGNDHGARCRAGRIRERRARAA